MLTILVSNWWKLTNCLTYYHILFEMYIAPSQYNSYGTIAPTVFRRMCIAEWECAYRRCWCQITCLGLVHLFVELHNALHFFEQQTHSQFYETPELRTRQRKQRQTLLKKRIPKWGCEFGLGLGLRSGLVLVSTQVRVRVMVRVRVIHFIQVKSGSHCYGHAAGTTFHPYFGIIDCRCNRACKWVTIHGVTPRDWSLLGTKRD